MTATVTLAPTLYRHEEVASSASHDESERILELAKTSVGRPRATLASGESRGGLYNFVREGLVQTAVSDVTEALSKRPVHKLKDATVVAT